MIKFAIREFVEVKNIEETISINNEKKHAMYTKKWQQVDNVLKTKYFWHFTWFDLAFEPGSRGRGSTIKTGE